MNKNITLIFAFIFSVVVYSQTTISGEVKNFGKRKVVLKGYNYNKSIKFNKKTNDFSETLKDLKTGHYSIRFKRRSIPIYLEAGKNFNINFDVKNPNTPIFKGANKEVNIYLSEKKKVFAKIIKNANRLFSLDEGAFLTSINTYKKALSKLIEKNNLPEKYKEFEKRNIFYGYARNIYNYEKYRKLLTKDDSFKVSENFPNPIEKLNFNEVSDYELSLDYRMLLREYFHNIATNSEKDYNLSYLNKVSENIENNSIKNDLIFEVVQKGIIQTLHPKKLYENFKKNSTDKRNNKEIKDLYKKLGRLKKGKYSPKFENYINYAGGKTSLDDLTGKKKYICIYLWTTWCSYCKKEIAKINELRSECDMNKIEFVGINVDNAKKIKKWRRMIVSKKMEGIQLFSGEEPIKLDFAKQYLVRGIPRFILLDPKGKIISANAPRPVKNGEKFTELLKEHGIIK